MPLKGRHFSPLQVGGRPDALARSPLILLFTPACRGQTLLSGILHVVLPFHPCVQGADWRMSKVMSCSTIFTPTCKGQTKSCSANSVSVTFHPCVQGADSSHASMGKSALAFHPCVQGPDWSYPLNPSPIFLFTPTCRRQTVLAWEIRGPSMSFHPCVQGTDCFLRSCQYRLIFSPLGGDRPRRTALWVSVPSSHPCMQGADTIRH